MIAQEGKCKSVWSFVMCFALEVVLAQTRQWGNTWFDTSCSNAICGLSTNGKKFSGVSLTKSKQHTIYEKRRYLESFSLYTLNAANLLWSLSLFRCEWSERILMLWVNLTMLVALKLCTLHTKAVKEKRCLIMQHVCLWVAVAKGRCGCECVAWSSVIKLVNVLYQRRDFRNVIPQLKFGLSNQTTIDLFFCQTLTDSESKWLQAHTWTDFDGRNREAKQERVECVSHSHFTPHRGQVYSVH